MNDDEIFDLGENADFTDETFDELTNGKGEDE